MMFKIEKHIAYEIDFEFYSKSELFDLYNQGINLHFTQYELQFIYTWREWCRNNGPSVKYPGNFTGDHLHLVKLYESSIRHPDFLNALKNAKKDRQKISNIKLIEPYSLDELKKCLIKGQTLELAESDYTFYSQVATWAYAESQSSNQRNKNTFHFMERKLNTNENHTLKLIQTKKQMPEQYEQVLKSEIENRLSHQLYKFFADKIENVRNTVTHYLGDLDDAFDVYEDDEVVTPTTNSQNTARNIPNHSTDALTTESGEQFLEQEPQTSEAPVRPDNTPEYYSTDDVKGDVIAVTNGEDIIPNGNSHTVILQSGIQDLCPLYIREAQNRFEETIKQFKNALQDRFQQQPSSEGNLRNRMAQFNQFIDTIVAEHFKAEHDNYLEKGQDFLQSNDFNDLIGRKLESSILDKANEVFPKEFSVINLIKNILLIVFSLAGVGLIVGCHNYHKTNHYFFDMYTDSQEQTLVNKTLDDTRCSSFLY